MKTEPFIPSTNQIEIPMNQTAEVLYELICSNSISVRYMIKNTGILNLSARISDLRKLGLDIPCNYKSTHNKFGRKIQYGTWSLNSDREKSLKIYKEINK